MRVYFLGPSGFGSSSMRSSPAPRNPDRSSLVARWANGRLHADVDSGWLESWLVVDGRLHGWGRSSWCEVVLVDPGREWFGEEFVVAAGVVEVVGGVDEGGGTGGMSLGPLVPGVEGVEALLGVVESVVVAVEAPGELAVDGEMLLESAAFGAELVSLVEEWSGAAGDFVERGLRGGDVVGGVGDGVSCGAAVEPSGGGECLFGLTVSSLRVVEVGSAAGDGVVVGCAVWVEVVELSGELVDAVLEFEVALLFDGGVGLGGGELTGGVVVELVEPVGDFTSGLQCRRRGCGGGEFASGAGGGMVGAVGGEDVFEDVDGVGDVVGVGDDTDQVLVLAAGDGDVQPAAGGGGGGEGDRVGGGVGLGAGFGGGVAELDVFGDIVGWQGDGAVSVDAGHGQIPGGADGVDGPVVAVTNRVAG